MTDALVLLKCPCCNSAVVMEEAETFRWAIYCQNAYCAICTPLCTSPAAATKVWNRREWKNESEE